MKLNDLFDHIYCINLDRREDRWNASLAEFSRIGLNDVERFSAVDGSVISSPSHLVPGEIGVILSNLGVIIDAYRKGYERILILEDDIRFSDNFVNDFDSWSSEIPSDWQMLYLGGNLVGWTPSPISEHVHLGNYVLAIHALGLHISAFDSIISRVNLREQIDVTYAELSRGFKSYLMIPRMAWQRECFSDIQNSDVNYTFLHKDQWGINS